MYVSSCISHVSSYSFNYLRSTISDYKVPLVEINKLFMPIIWPGCW